MYPTLALIRESLVSLRLYCQKTMESGGRPLGSRIRTNWTYRNLPSGSSVFVRDPLVSPMKTKSIWVGFVVLILSMATALAAGSVLRGVVKDPEGNPIKAAEVRIETNNGGNLIQTVRTDENGRYISGGLPAGSYRVTLVVSGAVKTSINNTTVHPDQPTQLNFDLTSKSAASTRKKGTHLVWVPPFTGSRLPGRWVEVDDNRSWAGAHVSTENVVQISGEELQRTIHSITIKRGQ